MKLLTQNSKIVNSGLTHGYNIYNFGITAAKYCPFKGKCAIEGGCYAQQGAYIWGNVAPVFEKRGILTQTDQFIPDMSKEIDNKYKRLKDNNKLAIRIHDSGDFYSVEYLDKWLSIIRNFSKVTFYAYTKSIPIIKLRDIPNNFTTIFSEGGSVDHLIDRTKDRHSRVFGSLEELLVNGYENCTKDDAMAFLGDNHRKGLVYHGAKLKEWTTDQNLDNIEKTVNALYRS